eukprot:3444490-Pyramimonas_sp.AAC.1
MYSFEDEVVPHCRAVITWMREHLVYLQCLLTRVCRRFDLAARCDGAAIATYTASSCQDPVRGDECSSTE